MEYGKGWRKGSGFPKLLSRTRTSKPFLLGIPNHLPFAKDLICQAGIGCCVASNGIKRPIEIWHRIRGAEYVTASDMYIYAIGRAQEFAGQNPDTIPSLSDSGMIPELAMLAVQRKGIVPEIDCPGPASGPESIWFSDDQSLAQAIANTEPTPDMLVNGYDARGLQFHAIDTSSGWYASVEDCMRRGLPVTISINADTLNDPRDGIVQSLRRTGHNHMVGIADVSNPDYDRVFNSWHYPGMPWGDQTNDAVRGTFKVKKGVLPVAAADLLTVDWAPTARTRST